MYQVESQWWESRRPSPHWLFTISQRRRKCQASFTAENIRSVQSMLSSFIAGHRTEVWDSAVKISGCCLLSTLSTGRDAMSTIMEKLRSLQGVHIDWVVLVEDEEEFDEAFRIIRQHIEDTKTKHGKFILRFSIERQ